MKTLVFCLILTILCLTAACLGGTGAPKVGVTPLGEVSSEENQFRAFEIYRVDDPDNGCRCYVVQSRGGEVAIDCPPLAARLIP